MKKIISVIFGLFLTTNLFASFYNSAPSPFNPGKVIIGGGYNPMDLKKDGYKYNDDVFTGKLGYMIARDVEIAAEIEVFSKYDIIEYKIPVNYYMEMRRSPLVFFAGAYYKLGDYDEFGAQGGIAVKLQGFGFVDVGWSQGFSSDYEDGGNLFMHINLSF